MKLLAIAVIAACSSSSTSSTSSTASGSGSGPPDRSPAEEARIRKIILDVNAHVFVIKVGRFTEYRGVVEIAQSVPGVTDVAAMVFNDVTMSAHGKSVDGLLKGLAPRHTRLRTDLERYLVAGSIAADATAATDEVPVALGDDVAKQLAVKVGDRLEIRVVEEPQRRDLDGPTRPARVTGIFHTGYEYDEHLAITSLAAAQRLVGHGDVVLGVELKLAYEQEAPVIAKQLGTFLGEPYKVVDWCELNRQLLHCL